MNVMEANGIREPETKVKRNGKWSETWRRFKKNKPAVIGLIILIAFLIIIVFANVIVPWEMVHEQSILDRLQKPNQEHWFGTDAMGRDIFARVIHGTRYSFAMAIGVTAASLLLGLVLGTLAAYKKGFIDNVIMRFCDILTSVPSLLMSMCIVAALGTSVTSLFIAMTVSGVPGIARMIRTTLLGVVDNEYVEACKACGTSEFRILFKHIVPNGLGPIIVSATMNVATMILACATLSFIGLGFQPPTPEWGAMLSEAREYMRSMPTMMIFPGTAIVLSTLSINLIGDGLRDALDPKLRD